MGKKIMKAIRAILVTLIVCAMICVSKHFFGITALAKEANGKSVAFNTILDMAQADLKTGAVVTTKGYYSVNDGGAATYTVSDSMGNVYVQMNNGLFANLKYTDTVNIRQLGAVGNGENDDSIFLQKALTCGARNVYIPIGTYNLANQTIIVPKGVKIYGDNANESVLKNLNLTAPNGIELSKIGCDGAAKRTLSTPEGKLTNTIMIDVSPVGNQSITYSDCVFRNADFVSFAFANKDGMIEKDIVTNCIFANIGRTAVYHSVNSKKAEYRNNSFVEIGNKSLRNGPVAAIWLGDVTNNTYTKSNSIVIKNNRFENLYTANDFDENSKHAINANFISIRGDSAIISGNIIKNLIGYGHDREAVYTKVLELTIDNNNIENGGCGEAYICNKGAAGNSKTIISNNKISGEFGCGIIAYGTAKIQKNVINISHCKAGIITGDRKDQDGNWPLEITDNTITCGAEASYSIDGQSISNYSSGNVIKVVNPTRNATISRNTINAGSEYKSSISVGNPEQVVTIEGNILNLKGFNGKGINVFGNKEKLANPSQNISITKNKISVNSGQRAVNLNFDESNSKRSIVFSNNEINFTGSDTNCIGLYCSSNAASDDLLEIKDNKSNINKDGFLICTNVKKVKNNNEKNVTIISP